MTNTVSDELAADASALAAFNYGVCPNFSEPRQICWATLTRQERVAPDSPGLRRRPDTTGRDPQTGVSSYRGVSAAGPLGGT
jgi:hypothetical protein